MRALLIAGYAVELLGQSIIWAPVGAAEAAAIVAIAGAVGGHGWDWGLFVVLAIPLSVGCALFFMTRTRRGRRERLRATQAAAEVQARALAELAAGRSAAAARHAADSHPHGSAEREWLLAMGTELEAGGYSAELRADAAQAAAKLRRQAATLPVGDGVRARMLGQAAELDAIAQP